ncbi:MAG TPA: transglycosylase domain-containing protein, partial [Pseudomonadales bacterium]
MTALARPSPMPLRRFVLVCVFGVAFCLGWVVVRELITFERQAHLLASLAHDIGFRVEPGPSRTVRFPVTGETDTRLGYTRLPEVLPRLEEADFEVTAQARWSPRLEWVVEHGLYAPYRRKSGAGLVVRDRHGVELHRGVDTSRSYPEIAAIPPLVVNSLLFIENRELLDDRHPYRNPAVEWDRLAHSLTVKAMNVIGRDRKTPGASTLATQLEKYHHSPGGRTESAGEKLRQMVSASLRAYLDGEDTVATRQRIVTEYLNTVPLAAAPGFGEVHGLGNGLHAWFGADFQRVNALLAEPNEEAAALAYRQVLSLLIAQRRPSYYLLQDRDALDALTDAHLRLLAREGVIGGTLLEQALAARLEWRAPAPPVPAPFPERKWPYFARARLMELMGVPSLYDLDRWDLSATTTVDGAVQRRVTELLRSLHDPERVRELGLREEGLLGKADPSKVIYSVTLMEHVDGANVIRVQADNADRPLDINRGVKLDLGSTAKLRTLVTYLHVIAGLYERYAALTPEQRAAVQRPDPLGRWVLERLRAEPDLGLIELLEAAMARTYSASPRRAFFTGGGRHVFGNFDRRDDHRTLTVREAFNRSVNLVFIRMMADVVAAYQAELAPAQDGTVLDPAAREAYLARFADQEGAEFLRRFYREYQGLAPEQVLERVLEKARPTPASVATVLASVVPDATPALLQQRLDARRVQGPRTERELEGLLERHSTAALSLPDRGFVARVHPLELWLAAALYRSPDAELRTLLADSAETRQQVYGWLFKTRNRHAQ